ncbi:epithelial membrane protein 1 isoform X1 [Clupea harengus]|uniref:Epithelial membrane protein 1 n=2 Tax=Clupea harengus TaxID=7950 RepID=A0A6P8F220_CLUHA|nr:epithelial membrane protein 1 isoform X1 [Clupea harengus]
MNLTVWPWDAQGLRKMSMLKALAGICFLHLTTIVLLFIAVIDDAWWFTNSLYSDIWGRWVMEFDDEVWVYTDLPSSYRRDYLGAVQAFAILACMFVVFSLFAFIYQIFMLDKGERFTITGVLQLVACFCLMVALAVYTDHFHRGEKEGWYGYSYILAWLAWLLSLLTGVLYIILKKKME